MNTTIQQLSIFLENKPGHLRNVCRILAEAQINLTAVTLADTRDFGILRVLAKDWEKAKNVLESNGIVLLVTEVIAVKVPDQPGGLERLLSAFEGTDINIEYMYGFNSVANGDNASIAVMVLRVNDSLEAFRLLQNSELSIIGSDEFFHSLAG